MWKNNAQNIAYIGRMTRPELYKPLTIDFAGAIDDYYNTKNAAQQNRREEERLQAEKDARQQQADALMRWQSVIDQDETLSPIEKELYRQDMGAYSKYRQGQQDFSNTQELERIRQQNALGLASYKNKLDMALARMKGGQGTTKQQNYEWLLGQGYTPEQAMAMTFGSGTEAVGGALVSGDLGIKGQQTYEAAKGKAKAENEQRLNLAEENDARIGNTINLIKKNPETVGVYAPIQTVAARVLGTDDDFLAKRGSVVRSLGEIQNGLIAEAKGSGQSGINTIAEIKQATKGLDENSSKGEILGALRAMQDSISRMRAKMNKKDEQQQPQIINYTELEG